MKSWHINVVGLSLTNSHSLLPLFTKFLASQRQFSLGKVIQLKTLDDGPFSILDGDRKAEHNTNRSVIASVREHAHAHPVIFWSRAKPGLHVIRGSLWKKTYLHVWSIILNSLDLYDTINCIQMMKLTAFVIYYCTLNSWRYRAPFSRLCFAQLVMLEVLLRVVRFHP